MATHEKFENLGLVPFVRIPVPALCCAFNEFRVSSVLSASCVRPGRYDLHPARALDPVSRVEVGEALHAVNPDACEEWVHWCMYRTPITSPAQAARMRVSAECSCRQRRGSHATRCAHLLCVSSSGQACGRQERTDASHNKVERFCWCRGCWHGGAG